MAVHCRKGLHYHQIPLLPWIPKLYLRHESHIAKPHGFYSKCAVDDGARQSLGVVARYLLRLKFQRSSQQ